MERRALWLVAWVLTVASGCAGGNAQRPPAAFGGMVGPLIIAHRGGALEAPENTLAAVRHGRDVGADYVEIDVTLTRDGEVVVIHDDTVDRTTGGSGNVREMTLVQLRKLRTGSPTWTDTQRERLSEYDVSPPDFEALYADQRVPTLEEVLEVENIRLMIELKTIEPDAVETLARAVLDEVRAVHAHDRVILGSFSPALLWAVHDLAPAIPLIGLVEDPAEVESMLGLPLQVLGVQLDLVETAVATAPAGLAVWAWTAYTAALAETAVEQGARGVITDVPRAVVETLRPEPEMFIGGDT